MTGIYKEFRRPEKIVFTNNLEEHSEQWKVELKKKCGTVSDDALESLATVTFEDVNGKTKVTLHSTFATDAIRDGYIEQGMNEGWRESFNRLAAHVEKQ